MSHTVISRLLSIILFISAVAVCQLPPASPTTPALGADVSVAELTKMAQAGDAEAQFALGRAYETGKGVPQNDDRAFIWYQKAAEQGLAKAQVQVGIMYRNGQGIEKNLIESLKWYRLAARQNSAAALFNLAAAYYNGDGVGVDDSEAYTFFLLARDAGSVAAEDGIRRLGVKMSAFDNDATYVHIGDMYANGEVLARDGAQAAKWYQKALEHHDPVAQLKMASLYDTGNGVPLDHAKAMMLCEAAAQKKFAPGQRCLAFHYQQGLGISQDLSRAVKIYKSAADAGDLGSMYLLGQMYWHGEGMKPDKVTAFQYLLLADNFKDPGVERDLAKLESEMTADEIKHGTNKAREWATKHTIMTGMSVRKQ